MHAVLITVTPSHRTEFIDCQKGKVCIAVLPILDVKTRSYSALELLKHVYYLQEFRREWHHNSQYSEYWPLSATQDESMVVNYVREELTQFRYWTLWMLQRYTVIFHYVITVFNDMFDHINGVMRDLAKKKT
jgi:hypothetical protein